MKPLCPHCKTRPRARIGAGQKYCNECQKAARGLCSSCKIRPHARAGQRYCRECHAAYMREWRKTHPPSPKQIERNKSRQLARISKHRGKLIPELCWVCGTTQNIEIHHPDYSKPLQVIWLCQPCHITLTNEQRAGRLWLPYSFGGKNTPTEIR